MKDLESDAERRDTRASLRRLVEILGWIALCVGVFMISYVIFR